MGTNSTQKRFGKLRWDELSSKTGGVKSTSGDAPKGAGCHPIRITPTLPWYVAQNICASIGRRLGIAADWMSNNLRVCPHIGTNVGLASVAGGGGDFSELEGNSAIIKPQAGELAEMSVSGLCSRPENTDISANLEAFRIGLLWKGEQRVCERRPFRRVLTAPFLDKPEDGAVFEAIEARFFFRAQAGWELHPSPQEWV